MEYLFAILSLLILGSVNYSGAWLLKGMYSKAEQCQSAIFSIKIYKYGLDPTVCSKKANPAHFEKVVLVFLGLHFIILKRTELPVSK